ncbi:hypothetical protein [Acinetobacter bereziniae]|uniref:hypothetical protein n=1 Tax=Acinetobacter bereziniae TaxID=106648 RepID=UPI000C2CA46D|nr:hypothetical protein [Acinetobacter bereziniae]ATZ65161.1 hypothetical protein BSR55_18430 [Acinetobacter bereziniae]
MLLFYKNTKKRDKDKIKYEDELDNQLIKQLHESTLKISEQCFGYKKLCVGLIGIVLTALLKLGSSTSWLENSIIIFVLCTGFWICDVIAYYYQKVNRYKMAKLSKNIKSRNEINDTEILQKQPAWVDSFFNASMGLYYYIMIIVILFSGFNLFRCV